MKKYQILMVCSISICLLFSLVAFNPESAYSQTYNWRWAGPMPPNNVMNSGPDWFAKELEKSTNGKVKISMHYGQTLGKIPDMADLLKKGVAQFALIPCKALSGVFPLHEAEAYPFVTYSSAVAMDAWNTCWRRGLFDKEFADFKVLWGQPTDPSCLFFRKGRVTKLEDLKGLLIRMGTGLRQEMIEAMGATPVSMSMTELYLALQKGTVDGITTGCENAISSRLNEVSKYCLWLPFGANFGMIQMMSMEYWKKLPADIQIIIEQLSQEAPYKFVEENVKNPHASGWSNPQVIDYLKKAGFDVYKLSSEEEERWIKTGLDAADKWVERKEAEGIPVRKVVEMMKEVADYYK